MNRLILLPLLFIVASCSANNLDTNPNDNSFVLKDVNILDVEQQQIRPGKTLIVSEGKIHAITDTVPGAPFSGLPVIDGKNGYVTPGLIDMHVHMYEKAAYSLTLSHGVTHVRIMNGVPKQLVWRDRIDTGLLVGSTSTVSSPIISGFMGAYLHHGVDNARDARQAVRQYQAQGYDLIKAYGNLSQASLSALIEEAQKLDIPVAKHGPHGAGDMSTAQLAGLQSLEHVEDIYQGPLNYSFDPKPLPGIVAALKAIEVPITPTLNIYYQLTKLSQEKERYLATTVREYTSDIIALEASRNQVKRWLGASEQMAAHNQKVLEFVLKITRHLHDAGIPLLVGSDSGVLLSPHGLATHNEMALLKQAGLSAFDVLAAATINPAKALQLDSRIGKIAPHYQADFIYSTGNPIDNLSVLKEAEAVIKNGQWHSRQALDKLRQDAIASRSFWEEFGVLIEAL